ncbi:hypothetical protein GVN24_22575 [Rhizobium sp. CRIBSB]|nr:hypothetical protein [Rhizobium sp. CRIBSB]
MRKAIVAAGIGLLLVAGQAAAASTAAERVGDRVGARVGASDDAFLLALPLTALVAIAAALGITVAELIDQAESD